MNSSEVSFDYDLGDGRIAHCWQAISQPYMDCEFSSGLVEGIEPDTIYLMLKRDDDDPYVLFLRPDEAQAIAWILNGALWSSHMIDLDAAGHTCEKVRS